MSEPKAFLCEYCNSTAQGESLPNGWHISYFKDCQEDLYYCCSPACKEAEDLSVAVHKAAWEAPAANQKHETWEAWLPALVPLLCASGYLVEGDGPEALDHELLEGLKIFFEAGYTPEAAMREELSNAC